MPLLWISLSFLLGIILASIFSLPTWSWILISILLFPLFFFLRSKITNYQFSTIHYQLFITRYFFLPTILFLGSAYYQFRQPNIDAFHIAFYNDRNYELLITGYLVEPPDYRDTYTNLKLRVEAVDTGDDDLPVDGFILVRVLPNQIYEYGERLRLRGQLKTPPENEDFSYKDYLARQSIYSYITKAEVTRLPGNNGNIVTAQVYKLKLRLLENTYRLFQDPEASLFAGILFGVETGLPRKLQEAFKNTGTAHIIAISGFNIAIIAGVLFSTFKYIFKERISAILSIIGILFYAFLVGGDAAVVRATLMGMISIFARQIGRRNAGLNALGFVALIMALLNPLVLWDVGFQLSFFATLGLILYAEPFSNFTENIIAKFSKSDISTFTKLINENIVLTFAAQLTTIPIMAYHFNRISLISFIANPFILPVQPAVMIIGGLSVFTSLIIYPLGQLMAWFAWAFAAYTIRIVEFFDKVPNGVMVLSNTSSQLMLLIYFPLLFMTFNWSAIKERFQASSASLRATALTIAFVFTFVCMIIFWRSSATAGDGRFHITFLEVGSADAVLIQTPEGRNILINGGASATELSDELGRRLPFFSPKLDWLIIASTQENQLSALPRVLERYVPENVLLSGNIQASFSAQALDKYFADEGIPVTRAEVGQKLQVGENAYIEIQA
ncbi:MAG: ComEC/Rec2 family competence protein, partial [Anaerolineales bacterium]|nr:ComEC/Rec2 family competence protein [Anaerolineales bacterium]